MLVEKQTIPAAALSEDSKHGRLLIDMAFECCSAIGVWPRGRGCNTLKIRVVVRVLVLSRQCSKQCKLFSRLAADQSVESIVSMYSLVAKMKDNRLKRNQSLLLVCQTTTKAALSIDLTARAASRALSLAQLNVAHGNLMLMSMRYNEPSSIFQSLASMPLRNHKIDTRPKIQALEISVISMHRCVPLDSYIRSC